MASRLYPGFGSGKGSFEGHFEVRSFASAGRKDLEPGDKVILPTSAFKEISRLKLPFPLLFKVNNERLKTANTIPSKDGKMPASATAEQYAGLMEFSAPEGVALMPQWMMNNLKLREGGKVGFSTARGLPQASYVKLRPHQQAFVDLAAEIGPRDLLEAAMRNYSVLSAGERIVVDVADSIYNLDVLEVKPERAATLYGNLDLEVDFAPVKGSPEDLAFQAAVAEERAVLAEVAATKAAEAAVAKVAKAAAAVPASAGKTGSKSGLPTIAGTAGKTGGSSTGTAASAGTTGAKPSSAEGGPRLKAGALAGVAGTGLKRTASAAGGGIAAIRAMATAQAPGSPTAAAPAVSPRAATAGKTAAPPAAVRPGSAAKRVTTAAPGAAASKSGSPSSAATAASRLAAAASGPACTSTAGGANAGSVAKAIAANVAAAIAQGGALGSKGGMSPARPSKGGSPAGGAGLLSPLPVGGGFGVYKGPLAAFEAAVARDDAVAVALDFDAPMVPVEALVHPFVALPSIAEEGPMVPASGTGASASAAGLRTPPRGGAAAASTAGLPSGAPVTAPGAFEGAGHRLGSSSTPAAHASGAKGGSGTPGKSAGSPSKREIAIAQAQAAKQAKAEEAEKQKERERRAAAALSRLSAPQPAEQTAPAPAPAAAAATPSKAAGAPASPSTAVQAASKPADAASLSDTASLHSAPVNADGSRTCALCRVDIQPAAYDLHILRCRRNAAYHKTACASCSALVLNKDMGMHAHCGPCGVLIPTVLGGVPSTAIEPCIAAHAAVCPQRQVTCECSAKMAACELEGHRDSCPFALETCLYCRVKQKRVNLAGHQDKCGSRTATCDVCGKLVVLKNAAAHSAAGGACEAIMEERRAKEAAKEAARVEAEAAKKREAEGGKEVEQEEEGKSSDE